MIVTGDTQLRFVHHANAAPAQLISVPDRKEAKELWMQQHPNYKVVDGFHSLTHDIDTPHTTFIDPASALLDFYITQVTSPLTEGHLKNHALAFDDDQLERNVNAFFYFFDSHPAKGVRDADSLLVTSAQQSGWRRGSHGNEKTLLVVMIAAGSDGTADAEFLIRLNRRRLWEIRKKGVVDFVDTCGRQHRVDFSNARIFVCISALLIYV